jgi:hypothetical protein
VPQPSVLTAIPNTNTSEAGQKLGFVSGHDFSRAATAWKYSGL